MNQKIKTQDAVNVYRIISTAKYTKLEDEGKIKVWKIARALKPIATKFDEDSKDAAEKMKPGEQFDEQLRKAQQYEMEIRKPDCDAEKLPMGAAEYHEFIGEFKKYQKLVNDAVKELSDNEVELDFEPISEETFGKLMASNDWTMDQATTLGDFICQ